jgi:hypothetical protein
MGATGDLEPCRTYAATEDLQRAQGDLDQRLRARCDLEEACGFPTVGSSGDLDAPGSARYFEDPILRSYLVGAVDLAVERTVVEVVEITVFEP